MNNINSSSTNTTPIRVLLHALNNQLGVVMGSLSLMETTLETDPARTKRMLNLAQEGAKKMAEVILEYKNQMPPTP